MLAFTGEAIFVCRPEKELSSSTMVDARKPLALRSADNSAPALAAAFLPISLAM